MHWHPEHLSYDICIPPAYSKNICDFTHEEAEAYFAWYMGVIPQRLAYLSETCAEKMRCNRSELDLSAESLRLLWRWFMLVAKTEPIPQPSNLRNRIQLTLQTEYIIRDIGMYFGETFLANHKSLYWGWYEAPQSDVFVNRPVIIGFEDRKYTPSFKPAFEPIHMVRVQAVKLLDNQMGEDDLIKVFRKWEQFCVD